MHRERPTVPRLDHLPVNQSFPSGHVAASVAVYVALALLVTSRFARRSVHVIAWTLALLLPLVVATSRMYRGMHHPTDAASGALVGLCAVAISLLAVRAADAIGDAPRQRACLGMSSRRSRSSRTAARRSAEGSRSCGACSRPTA